jgi:hypothetical protein
LNFNSIFFIVNLVISQKGFEQRLILLILTKFMKNLHLQFVRRKPILLNNFTPLNLVGKHGVWRLGLVGKREKIFHFRISARRATIRHATRIVFTIPLSPMSVLPDRSLYSLVFTRIDKNCFFILLSLGF